MMRFTPAAIAILIAGCAPQFSTNNTTPHTLLEAVPASFSKNKPERKSKKRQSLDLRVVKQKDIDRAIKIAPKYGGTLPGKTPGLKNYKIILVDKDIKGRYFFNRSLEYSEQQIEGKTHKTLIVSASFREFGMERTITILEGSHETFDPHGNPTRIDPEIDGRIDRLTISPDGPDFAIYKEPDGTLTFTQNDIKHARSLYRETVSNLQNNIDWSLFSDNPRYPSDIKHPTVLPNHGPHYICPKPEKVWIYGKHLRRLPKTPKRKQRDCIRLKRYSF